MAGSKKRAAVHAAPGGSGSAAVAEPSDWRTTFTVRPGFPFELLMIPANELRANPANWRLHPPEQRAAFQETFEEVGWAGAALFNLTTGHLVDGHLRTEMNGDAPIPVLVGRWTAAQENKILLSLDPIANMAKPDKAKLESLMKEVGGLGGLQVDLDKMLRDLSAPAVGDASSQGAAAELPKEETEEQQDGLTIEESYSVLVKCQNEADQRQVLGELQRYQELDVRALTVGFPEPEKIEAAPIKFPEGTKTIKRSVDVKQTPRVLQMAGQFDVPVAKKNSREWHVNLKPLEEKPWQIGLIVGPSGSGKSTIAEEYFGDRIVRGWQWPKGQSVLDGFPKGMNIIDITSLLSSVGFNSPPSWMKPFDVLSNGEKFRVELARTLAEAGDLAVVDEFTSVVDRQVAQMGSAALAKTVRATGRKFVAVGCHYDVIEWLQPDWVVDLAKTDLQHRVQLEWRSLRRRPEIQLSIRRASYHAWERFRDHHYLSGKLHRSAKCFVAEVDGTPAAFSAAIWYPHHASVDGGWWREHRTVCLPDYQGVGIGNALSEFVASLYLATGKQFRSTTSHPSMIRHRVRSRQWETLRLPSLSGAATRTYGRKSSVFSQTTAYTRMVAGFSYVGQARPVEAKQLGVLR